ncbi:rhodanese-like domain-containing protein [Altererythrobacter sp.]|uniref:rhodanese-like domain-containing protein n=1 Tax=Altererythrobacter sp. TaxID=1872480 RepID=UPI001B18C1A2|nr:rhodanese-like domain-containing protein [Altererythrobacter sp.]MBO6610088.1 rhodanese-like domain-containing protein [Altererythrobacter sp.]MBO6642714.1 rhodanese-like domain-containing protein [Altererythrobacter sp.]MBO6708778.1 rhodanese-like domain-containing protein [Altererythrobacter sp.]
MRFATFALAAAIVPLSGCMIVDNSGDRIVASVPERTGAEVETLPASELAALIASGEVVLIDVRTPQEYDSGRIASALNAPVQTFDAASIPRDSIRETILYCRSSGRSKRAADMLAAEWGTKVRHLEGGIIAWQDEGLEIELPTGS